MKLTVDRPSIGTFRVVSFFAWFPVTVSGGETRWLENVTVRQMWHIQHMYDHRQSWHNLEFLSDKAVRQ